MSVGLLVDFQEAASKMSDAVPFISGFLPTIALAGQQSVSSGSWLLLRSGLGGCGRHVGLALVHWKSKIVSVSSRRLWKDATWLPQNVPLSSTNESPNFRERHCKNLELIFR